MIFDRTYADIVNAKRIFSDKVQKFISLSESEQAIVDKAFFNLTALNRITSKISEIWVSVAGRGGEIIENSNVRVWNEQEIFKASNFVEIRQNIGEVIEQLDFLQINTEQLKNDYAKINGDYTYTNLNNLEKMLFDLGEILAKEEVKWVIQDGNAIYIFGAINATLSEGVLTIE
jgi:hypothetical protein